MKPSINQKLAPACKLPSKPRASLRKKGADAPGRLDVLGVSLPATASSPDRIAIKRQITEAITDLSGMGKDVKPLKVTLGDRPAGDKLPFDAWVKVTASGYQPSREATSQTKGTYDMKSKDVQFDQMPKLP